MSDDQRMSIEEMNAICEEALNEPEPEPDPSREGIDWIRTKEGELRHPLQHRCYESAFSFRQRVIEIDSELLEHRRVSEAVFEFMRTAIKLSGALTGTAEGHPFQDVALTVAWVKRALEPDRQYRLFECAHRPVRPRFSSCDPVHLYTSAPGHAPRISS